MKQEETTLQFGVGCGIQLVFLCCAGSAVTCLCGARSIHGSPVVVGVLDLTASEGQVLPSHTSLFVCAGDGGKSSGKKSKKESGAHDY